MRKKRILLHTNPPWLHTGLAENAKTLLPYLWKTGKYEIAHYCSQTSIGDPNLTSTPWKSYGCLPTDPNIINELNRDPSKARNVSYGSWNIDNVIKDFKPDVYISSDDIWLTNKSDYIDKPWWKQINSMIHVTVDSLPVLESAFEHAEHTRHYLTWAKFAAKEMRRFGPKFAHVGQIYGAMNTAKFSPITTEERQELRKRFGISENTTVFLFVGRNQLRKQFLQTLEAFRDFKRENPTADAKLWFHTSYSEQGSGWNIPKLAAYFGVPMTDILATYICKKCGEWMVHPYVGEDINCPICKTEKSLITVNIVNGVPGDQMKYIYGIADACVSAFSSGGLEYQNVQSLLCGKPLACTNYSCGEDFCEQDFVHTLGFTKYFEQGTSFIKATTNPKDIKTFMTRVWRMPRKELLEWGQKGRDWAVKTFSIETIGAQWEALFDSVPFVDWDKVDLSPQVKNDQFPFPEIENSDEFITSLYTNILKMNEPVNGDGHKHWASKIKEGMDRRAIYDYFISVARTENQKNGVGGTQQSDFWSLIDKTTGQKRILFVIKESMGDCLICTQLFESLSQEYPSHDLYVATKPQNFEIFEGNPHVFKLLPYMDVMDHEMIMCGAGQKEPFFDVYLSPAILTQVRLGYLYSEAAAFKSQIRL